MMKFPKNLERDTEVFNKADFQLCEVKGQEAETNPKYNCEDLRGLFAFDREEFRALERERNREKAIQEMFSVRSSGAERFQRKSGKRGAYEKGHFTTNVL